MPPPGLSSGVCEVAALQQRTAGGAPRQARRDGDVLTSKILTGPSTMNPAARSLAVAHANPLSVAVCPMQC
jgi:hypothetical protein